MYSSHVIQPCINIFRNWLKESDGFFSVPQYWTLHFIIRFQHTNLFDWYKMNRFSCFYWSIRWSLERSNMIVMFYTKNTEQKWTKKILSTKNMVQNGIVYKCACAICISGFAQLTLVHVLHAITTSFIFLWEHLFYLMTKKEICCMNILF